MFSDHKRGKTEIFPYILLVLIDCGREGMRGDPLLTSSAFSVVNAVVSLGTVGLADGGPPAVT